MIGSPAFKVSHCQPYIILTTAVHLFIRLLTLNRQLPSRQLSTAPSSSSALLTAPSTATLFVYHPSSPLPSAAALTATPLSSPFSPRVCHHYGKSHTVYGPLFFLSCTVVVVLSRTVVVVLSCTVMVVLSCTVVLSIQY